MADSEVRQKFEAWAREHESFKDHPSRMDPFKLEDTIPSRYTYFWGITEAAFAGYSAGMRAGEIAQREKIWNAARAEYDKDPDQTAADCEDTTPEAIYLNGFIRGIEAVYKSALPAAPEEKKP